MIATDPPFNKNKEFYAKDEEGEKWAKFQDRWSWDDDVQLEWVDKISDDHPRLMQAIESARYAHSDGMGAFMCFMSVRLMEMHRVLKPTGSIYLHFDSTASHYLKACMDAIFGQENFRNEIIWHFRTSSGKPQGHFIKNTNTILFYAKSKEANFNPLYEPWTESTLRKWQKDEHGRIYRMNGGKRYYINPAGKLMDNVWHITLSSRSQERVKYPTQKPLALYKRIVMAGSNEGDIVLDPFCGCATTLVAAEREGRDWVGIDLWEGAHEMVIKRLADDTHLEVPQGFSDNVRLFYKGQIHYETTPPERTDKGEEAAPFMLTPQERKEPKEPWQKLSHKDMTEHFVEAQSITTGLVLCAGCGREVEKEFTELDHITPRSDRGENDISNRILLCRPCNREKSNSLTMPGLFKKNEKIGWMRDKKKAERARKLAEERYKQIKYGEVPLRIGEEQ